MLIKHCPSEITPLGADEILLRNMKSSLPSDEIAPAVGGFHFTETFRFLFFSMPQA